MSVATLDTPPSSDGEPTANLPPSPPLSPTKRARLSLRAVDRLIGTFRLARRGILDTSSDWRVFQLSEAEFEQFHHRLRQEPALLGYFEDKVRYDWDPAEGRLVWRMPAPLHERFNRSVEDAIAGAIRGLVGQLEEKAQNAQSGGSTSAGEDGELAAELRQLDKGGSTTFELRVPPKSGSLSGSEESAEAEAEEKVGRKSPDATFYHPSQRDHPTLVMEVSYSQQQKDLPRLADTYIVGSSHAIRAVLCIKLPYLTPAAHAHAKKLADGDQTATYSLWRPSFLTISGKGTEEETMGRCKEDVKAQRFRDGAGKLVNGHLELRPEDLLPLGSEVLDRIDPTSKLAVRIDHRELYDALQKAEAAEYPSEKEQEELKKWAQNREALRPKRFRRRTSSPDEQLSDGREEVFLLQEMRERQKEAEADDEYTETARRVRRKVTLEEDVVGGASTSSRGGEGRAEVEGEAG